MGVPAATCKDCASGMKMCGVMEHMCNLMFCHPLCTHSTWTVKVKATSAGPSETFQEEVNGKPVQKAMKGQFKTYGCVEKFSCCDKDSMFHWMENRLFEEYTQSTFPILGCKHHVENQTQKAEFCSKCKEAVEVEAIPKECDPREKTPADMALLEMVHKVTPPEHVNLSTYLFHSLQGLEIDSELRKGLTPEHVAFLQLHEQYDVEKPVHKSLYDRCDKLKSAIEGQLPGLQAEFQERVCGCLGCCQDDQCFYPDEVNNDEEVPTIIDNLGFLHEQIN